MDPKSELENYIFMSHTNTHANETESLVSGGKPENW